MSASDAHSAETVDGWEETPLQAAVWLAQDLGLDMPPMPEAYAGALQEFVMGRIFATSGELAALKDRASIARALESDGWPRSGMTLGFVEAGSAGLWFYTLVGERQIVSVSLRLRFLPEGAAEAGAALISATNSLRSNTETNDMARGWGLPVLFVTEP